MNPLGAIVLEEVGRRGRVTFREFMEWALYHPLHGYYMRGAMRTGRQGDFYTNVQTGGLFGRLLAESFIQMWDALEAEHFVLVELGGADGALAEQVLTALEAKDRLKGLSYCLVEKGPAAREHARRRLSRFPRVKLFDDISSFEHTAGVCGCVFSNEYFDALPFHRVVRTAAGLSELYVEREGDRLVEKPGELSTPRLAGVLQEQAVELAEGQRAEVCLALDDAVAGIGRVLGQGFVLTVDYGEPSADLYRETRLNGTLQVYAKHRAESDPFAEIGERDLTAHVDFSRLAELGRRNDIQPLIFASQGAYLLNSGESVLKEAVEAGRAAAVQQLVHPESFGGKFHVLVQGKNVADAALPGGRVNRVRRLAAAAPTHL